jgi:hypothetical protein
MLQQRLTPDSNSRKNYLEDQSTGQKKSCKVTNKVGTATTTFRIG